MAHATETHHTALDLESILDDAAWGGPALAYAVARGEELRRALAVTPRPGSYEEDVLERYDALLEEARAELHKPVADFEVSLRVTIDGLFDPRDVETALVSVDSSLSAAAAACRMGALRREALDALGRDALAFVEAHAGRCPELWARAAEREDWLGDDPEYSGLYAYLGVLAIYGREET